jgi:hypothetical protein
VPPRNAELHGEGCVRRRRLGICDLVGMSTLRGGTTAQAI